MKKTTRKLVICRETVRALRVLDRRDLTRAVGGDGLESGAFCPARAIVASTTTCPSALLESCITCPA